MNRFLMMAVPAVAMVASAAQAEPMRAREYVMAAGAGDLYERQSSQLVMETTRDPRIRTFARHMITDHSKSTADVKAAAARSHLRVPPPMLNPAQRDMMAQLRAARGADRANLYIRQQRTAHDQALALHQSYARDGDAPALRRAAAKIAPVVQRHIDMLRTM